MLLKIYQDFFTLIHIKIDISTWESIDILGQILFVCALEQLLLAKNDIDQ